MQQQQPIDYSRKWQVMAAVGMSIFLATLDISIVNIVLPTLVKKLNTDFATIQWVILSYLLVQTTLMLGVGRLGDMLGKKTIYTAGLVIFTTGSLLCGLSPTVYWLIGFRAVQGIGAAMTMALGMAIITEAFPHTERGKALGISGAIVSVGIVTGPTLGGLLLEYLSWHWIFFVNIPPGIIGTYMAFRLVPHFKPVGASKFDYMGAIALFVSLLSLLFALTLGQQAGSFSGVKILLLFAIWLISLIGFILIEWKTEHPIIDLTIFKNSLFSINLITGFISFVAIAGTFIIIPFYLENILGYKTSQIGLLLATIPIFMGVAAPISGILSDRFGTRLIAVIGLVTLLGGYYAISTLNEQTTWLGYLLRFLPIGIGMGIFQSPNNSAIMGTVGRNRLGIASGLLSLSRTLGQTVGIATIGALWAGRVTFHSGTVLAGGVTTASNIAQVSGMQDSFFAITIMIAFAVILGIWSLAKERQLHSNSKFG